MTVAQCVACNECPAGTYRGPFWTACDGNGMNDTQTDCIPCSQCDAGSYRSPSYIACTGKTYSDTQKGCIDCAQSCEPGEYRALCQQSGVESLHCEQSCTKLVDLRTPSSWAGIFITGANAKGPTGEPVWLDLHFNTSSQVSKTIRSSLLPITIHRFVDVPLGEFGGAFTVSLDTSCSCDLCDLGSYKSFSGPATCSLCNPGNYSNTRGVSKCPLCAAGKFSTESAATVCKDCPVWAYSFAGKTSCRVRPSPPPSPFVVAISLGSPLEPSAFNAEVQGTFRTAIAAAAQVDVDVCQITDISGTARRAGGSTVAMKIGAASQDAASAITSGLSTDNINAQMAKVGLPGVTVLSIRVAANDAFVNTNTTTVLLASVNVTSDFFFQDVGPLKMWIWIAIGGGVVSVCCCASLALCCFRRKKVHSDETDPDVTADSVIIDMLPEKMEKTSTLTGDLVFLDREESEEDDDEENGMEEAADWKGGRGGEGGEGGDGKLKEKPEVEKCEYCKKNVCTPKMNCSVKLHGLVRLKAVNDREGWVVKLFKQKHFCAVELDDGHVVTVAFKHVKCSEPKEKPKRDAEGEDAAEGKRRDAGGSVDDTAGVLPGEATLDQNGTVVEQEIPEDKDDDAAGEKEEERAATTTEEAEKAGASAMAVGVADADDAASVAQSIGSLVGSIIASLPGAPAAKAPSVAGSQTGSQAGKAPSVAGSVGKAPSVAGSMGRKPATG